jgi:hypothetical protein
MRKKDYLCTLKKKDISDEDDVSTFEKEKG